MTARHSASPYAPDPEQPGEDDPVTDGHPIPAYAADDPPGFAPDDGGDTAGSRTGRRGLIAALAGAGAFAAACSRIVGGKHHGSLSGGPAGGSATGGAATATRAPKAAATPGTALRPGGVRTGAGAGGGTGAGGGVGTMRGGGGLGQEVALAGGSTPKAAAGAVPAQRAAAPQPAAVPPLTTPAFLKERSQLVHLLSRVTYGVTPELVADVSKVGAANWLHQQLRPATVADGELDGYLQAAFPLLTQDITTLRRMENTTNEQQMTLAYATEARMIWSKKQVFETMVDFFRQHLNVVYPGDDNWQESIVDDREVWRPLVLGKYSALLSAVAKAPSMLRRLNNDQNTKDASNENWGREVLELYSVGVNAGYNQHDVVQCAKVFTGWTIQYDDSKPGWRQFEYNQDAHFVGPVKVLGWSNANTSAARGVAVGESLLSYLAHHPNTASRIATKLAIRFVSDTPPPALVARLAHTYLANDTAIVPVLEQLFSSAEFKASVGVKTLRPLEDIVRTMRILDVKPATSGIGDLDSMYYSADGMGMAPLKWSFPNGYPDTQDAWAGAGGLLARFNMHRAVAGGWWKKFTYSDLTQLFGAAKPATVGAAVDVLAKRLFFQRMAGQHRNDILAFLGVTANTPLHDPEHPSPKVSLDMLVTMLLHSPYFELR